MNCIGDGLADLAGQTLLHLEPSCEHVNETGDLAEADDFSIGHIGDVSLAEKWEKMMLALREELDILDDDHLIVIDVEESFVENVCDVHGVATGEKCHGLFHALGSAEETVAGGVFSNAE